MKDINSIYEITFYCDDLKGDTTIKEYLKELLLTLWKEGEGFSGKRPFGNSGWEYDLVTPLIQGGVLEGFVSFDEDGYLQDRQYDRKAYDNLVTKLIEGL